MSWPREQTIEFSIDILSEIKGNPVERAEGPNPLNSLLKYEQKSKEIQLSWLRAQTIEFSIEILSEIKGNPVELAEGPNH